MNILENIFKNFISKFVYALIIIMPFILLFWSDIDLFSNNLYMGAFILSMVLLSLNSLTDFTVEIPGFKATSKNTGASIEIHEDLKNRTYKIITHGVADENKAKKIVKEMRSKK